MTFTRIHYKAIAKILGGNNAKEQLIEEFCRFFQEDNCNFDEERFKDAVRAAELGD